MRSLSTLLRQRFPAPVNDVAAPASKMGSCVNLNTQQHHDENPLEIKDGTQRYVLTKTGFEQQLVEEAAHD